MPSRVAVTRALPAPTSAAGTTFDEEYRAVMWRRARAALAVGLAISALMNVLVRWVIQRPDPLATPYSLLVPDVYLVYVAVFGLGLALVWRDWWSARTVALIVLAILVASALLDVALSAVLFPDEEVFYGAALFLFLAAALLPWPLGFQVTLALVFTLAYPVAATIAASVVPEVSAFWEARTDASLGQMILDQAIGVGLLAAVSIYITRTLYTMRRQLHAASRLGNYVIEGELGKGGMGKVYKAQHAMIRRPTAVKVMEGPAARSPEALARFEREVQLSATLTHPNTITIYDFGRSEEATFYYVMEYLDGVDLQRIVERYGPLPPERTTFILRQVCGSLAEAHSRGIIHRDLKPSNIFLTERGGLCDFVKVLDFGLAKQMRSGPDDVQLTQVGSVFGTPLFMAPETAAEDHVDHRADQYSIGCVAYWMLAGRPPFEGTSPFDVIAKHLKVDPRPPSEVSEMTISQDVDDIVLKCLAKSAGDRFRDMDQLARALDSLTFDHPWNGDQAREWWTLHLAESP
jgi:serine/threonine-protein kinase